MKLFDPLPAALCVAVMAALASASTPIVTVSTPANNSQVGSQVHFVASAASSDCASGISAIRIYSAPHKAAYTVTGGNLDSSISLSPGTYNTVVQAWDNCGGVGKTPITITVSEKLPPPRFLYSTDQLSNMVYGYVVNAKTGALSATGQGPQPAHSGPSRVVSDLGGYRLYVINRDSNDLNAYFIDRRYGDIYAVPGSPFAIGEPPADLRVHPSGKFVYVTLASGGVSAFAVQSDGSLKVVPGSPFAAVGESWGLSITPSGKYLYVSDYTDGQIDAFSINQTTGVLIPVAGSPFIEEPVGQGGCLTGALEIATDSPGNFLIVPRACGGGINVYSIDNSNGSIADVPGSPFAIPYFEVPASLSVDPLGRFIFLSTEYCFSGCTPDIQTFTFNSQTGAMTFEQVQQAYGVCGQLIRADPSGSYLYGIGDAHDDCNGTQANPSIWGESYNSGNGTLAAVPGSPFPSQNGNYEFAVGLWVTQ
jgi:6-phosphogluconolactonase (cycloisomerase 2 family)